MQFKRVYIEITNSCNLACSFCIQNSRKPRKMSVEEFSHVISQIKPYTKYVYLHVLGEPLSHPDLETFLTICKDANLQVMITTNGTLLKQKADMIANASCVRQVNISVHSFPSHQQPLYLSTIFEKAGCLAARGIHVNLRLWSLKTGELSNDTDVLLDQILTHYGKSKDDILLKRLARFDLADHIHLHFEDIFEWPALSNPYVNDHGTCLGMKTMCAILSDGRVVPCCLDSKGDITLGNIFTTPFKEIIDSQRCKDMIQGFQSRKITETLCKHCSYRLRFK